MTIPCGSLPGQTKIIGNTLETDIEEMFVDRHTLIVPDWPGIVEDSTNGLSEDLKVDLLLYESVDEIAEAKYGQAPCATLTPDRPEAPISRSSIAAVIRFPVSCRTPILTTALSRSSRSVARPSRSPRPAPSTTRRSPASSPRAVPRSVATP